MDETYVKISGKRRYVYVPRKRDIAAAHRFFTGALTAHAEPDEVATDLAQALETTIEQLIPNAFHNTEQHQNNRVECDHSRLKARLRPMRGLKRDQTASVFIKGHALIQNIRRGHYELGSESTPHLRLLEAFSALAEVIREAVMPATNPC